MKLQVEIIPGIVLEAEILDDPGTPHENCACQRCQRSNAAQDRFMDLIEQADRNHPVTSDDVIAVVARDVPVSECACDDCKGMCQRTACCGTPQDIKRLLDAGHGDKLVATQWCAGLRYGIPEIPMVQLLNLKEGPYAKEGGGTCPLWDKSTGLCTVHAIKPTEGRMGQHDTQTGFYDSPLWATVLTWLLPTNRALVCELFRAVGVEPSQAGVRESLPSESRPD